MRPTAAFLVVLFLVVLGTICSNGCARRGQPETPSQQPQGAEHYGRLPGLRETPDLKLRSELARIVDEGGTPELLGQNGLPGEENVAAGLTDLFPASGVESILQQSSEIFPGGQFSFDPVRLQKAINFRQTYEAQRRQARQALGRPHCNFGIRYQAGFTADLSFIDVVRVCARLEAFQAAESLSDDLPSAGHLDAPPNGPATAIESLGYMLRLAACLAAEKHATCRLEAAFARMEALDVLQSIVEHPKATRQQLQQLYNLIQAQLAAWPSDADAWIGDRALGMYIYEVVRDGNLISVLTEEEIQQFAAEGILEELPKAAQRTVNQDELYYLETMRKIIDSCSQPYHVRAALLESIRDDLHKKRNSPDFPLVAGRLLLPDMEKGHAIQALDRANCEAWALALAHGAGCDPPAYKTNPLTGKQYKVDQQEGLVTVWKVAGRQDLPPAVADVLVSVLVTVWKVDRRQESEISPVLVPDLGDAQPEE